MTKMSQEERAEMNAAAERLGLPIHKPWYGYGKRSPRILVARLRNRYRPVFRLKMAWQRAWRGYDDSDLWSLNYTIANLIVVGCRQMRESGYSYPGEFSEPPYGDGQGFDAWAEVLRRIEEGFQAWIDEDGWFFDKPDQEAKFKDAMSLFSEWFSGLWD